jgi:dTMP kinase
MAGLFISFEGVDGAGKSTQVARLCQYAETLGLAVSVTREPGGTALGLAIRQLLLHGVVQHGSTARHAGSVAGLESSDGNLEDTTGRDPANGSGGGISVRAEALLFAADRAQHVAQIIRPALQRGDIVISDRYLDSSLAYQAGGRELTTEVVRRLSMWASDSLLPARTYLLDMDPGLSHHRLTHSEDRMEAVGIEFQRRTRQAFLDLACKEPQRFRVIDATRSAEEVWETIRADFDALLAAGTSFGGSQGGPR